MQKASKNRHKKFCWNVKVTYCNYENNTQRDLAYTAWAKAFLNGLSNKQKKKRSSLSVQNQFLLIDIY